MVLLYIYASIAAAGILALPSYGAWYNASHVRQYDGYGSIRRRRDGDDHKDGVDWWELNYEGMEWQTYESMPYPISLGLQIAFWPVILIGHLGHGSIRIASKLLALPGKALVRRKLEAKQANKFLTEAEQEVEKLLSSSS